MNNLTSSTPNRQMTLAESQFSNIRRIEHDEETLYSVIDIIAHFAGTSRARKYWSDTKQRLNKEGFQVSDRIGQLNMVSVDGKQRKTDVADMDTCLRILMSIPVPDDPVKRARLEEVKGWMAALGAREIKSAAAARREAELQRSEAAGYGQHPAVKQLRQRNQNIDTFKSLMTAVNRVCENPHYGHFVNAEYLALFGEIASDLKTILKTESIRNALPMVQLTTLTAAESRLEMVIEHYNHMSMDDLLNIVDKTIRPMGDDLRAFCDMIGVHHVTGERLLKSGE